MIPVRFKAFCSRPPGHGLPPDRAGQNLPLIRSVDISSWDITPRERGRDNTMRRGVRHAGRIQQQTKPEPSLATEWKLIKPHSCIDFAQGVKFSDGSEFTADDASFAGARQAKAPTSPSTPRALTAWKGRCLHHRHPFRGCPARAGEPAHRAAHRQARPGPKNKSVEPRDIKTRTKLFLPTATRWAPEIPSSNGGRPTSAWCWSQPTGGARASAPPT